MGLRINTNISALNAQNNLRSVRDRLEINFRRLSSGLRTATAADDAAGATLREAHAPDATSNTESAQNPIDQTQACEGRPDPV